MLVHWIWLSTREHMSALQKYRVLQAFSDPEDAYNAEETACRQVEGLSDKAVKSLLDKDLGKAQKILRQCANKHISICTIQDALYPHRLKQIFDPPLVLYYKGYLPEMDSEVTIGTVGTRKASLYGLNTAHRLGYQIAACGGIVVSGVAKGIDAMAMKGALLAGGTVVGVLGGGVDVVYPRENRSLFEAAVQNGCLISEYPPGEPAHGWHFPIRNRIISGLSAGVLVIEAPEGSGSLITAKDALKENRDIFCVPGKVDDPGFAGSNALLHEGATLVRDGWDVMSQYEFRYPGKVHPMQSAIAPECAEEEMPKVAQKSASPKKTGVFGKKSEKITVDNKTQPPYSDIEEILPKLSETQQSIVKLLTREKLVDEIIGETGLSAATVSTELTMLQLQGVITMLPGNRVARKETQRK